MEVDFSAHEHPNLGRWFKEMRTLPICAADLKRARDYVVNLKDRDIEKRRIFWRGDRIEWMLARGFHAWARTNEAGCQRRPCQLIPGDVWMWPFVPLAS
jgi:hypothetical protein